MTDEQYTKRTSLALKPSDLRALKKLARKAKKTQSEWLRDTIRREHARI